MINAILKQYPTKTIEQEAEEKKREEESAAQSQESRIQLIHLAYDKATTPKELQDVYNLYKKEYYVTDTLACERALQIAKIFDYSLDESTIWKLREYELGNLEAGITSIERIQMGPVVGTHTGPETYGIIYLKK